MRFLFILLFPVLLMASEKELLEMTNERCSKIKIQAEKNACVTGTFIDYCNKPKNQSFCKKEAFKADYSKRSDGAKEGLKKIYLSMRKARKENGKYELDLRKVFPKGNKESYYYVFGVPEKCPVFLKEGSPTNSTKLHLIFERTTFAEKGIIKTLNSLPCPRKEAFRVYAIGQIDDDLTFDIWYVDNKRRIKHYRSDFKR